MNEVVEAESPETGSEQQTWRSRLEENRLVAFYRRHERYAPALFFFGGVAWDASTLRRIDAWFDNLFLLVYLVASGVLIVLAQLAAREKLRSGWLRRYQEWYPAGIQFFLGALFSAYVVYYSQSASLTHSSLFLVLLVVLLVGNEFVHKRLASLYLLVALYLLAAFSFFIFFVPVVVRMMSYATFLAGGVLALILVYGVLVYLHRRGVFKRYLEYLAAVGLIVGMFALLNVFWIMNWIPPVPLALRHGGVYHNVAHKGDVYDLVFERPEWYEVWRRTNDTYHYVPGDAVYCFAAVFAPGGLHTQVYHQWSRFNPSTHSWEVTDRIGYKMVGERDNGYRGYTLKRNVSAGQWRVDVLAEDGKILGRIPFRVEWSTRAQRRLFRMAYD